ESGQPLFHPIRPVKVPVSNGCTMTYMYPTYIPIPTTTAVSPAKYGLYLYHEGWKKIDFKEHLKKLSGIPILFIPGNGGSYKQVRSLAAESDRAYQAGPLERTFYQEASLTPEEGGEEIDVASFQLPNQYDSRLDWFTVDLEGEHSAMDSAILEEHAEYVVHSIHRILDQYKESYETREREGAVTSGSLPKSVILVGHSMGGFVARAAVAHNRLRKSAVETILTLSSPHQYPPVALQPSLGHYFARVNHEWRKGYEVQTTRAGHYVSDPVLSHVVVISISGSYNDYQVRSKSESLDGIVPPTHDSRTGQPFSDKRIRLAIFSKMLRSGIPQSFNWMMQSHLSQQSLHVPSTDVKDKTGSLYTSAACPRNVHWSEDGLERDLYIQTTTVTVLAMDGRRRWLDIQKLGSNGRSHFMFVTNLAPCSGVRLHLWPEKRNSTSELPVCIRILEVTSKMVRIPSGPAPRQIEPGSQTEQAPPSAIFRLGPEDMRGFRFLTISVAPRPTISGRPPPAVSMAVGQFFNPEEGERSSRLGHCLEISLKEDHPLALNLSFTTSLGLLPVMFSLKTAGCGIKNSGLPDEQADDIDNSKLCKLRCFPPVAFAWDDTSGLHIFPNVYSETIVVDSSPALWSSPKSSEKTSVMLLVDPHCSYRSAVAVSVTAAASRFLLLYNSQVLRVVKANPLLVTALAAITLLHFAAMHKDMNYLIVKKKAMMVLATFPSKVMEIAAPIVQTLRKRIGMGHSFPWLVDSALCTGVILHGIFTSKPEFNSFLVSLPGVRNLEVRLNFMYLVAGYYSYLSSLALAPFRVFYAMTAIGFTSFALMILQRWNREKGEAHFGSRKHSHRH
ncbi:hydrolase, partial [Prunus dulcis]